MALSQALSNIAASKHKAKRPNAEEVGESAAARKSELTPAFLKKKGK